MSEHITPPPTWLHIGTGAFHRAHQAYYLDRLNRLSPSGWNLVIGNIRPDLMEVEKALQRSAGAFRLEAVAPGGRRTLELIRSITGVIPWEASRTALVEAGADPTTRIVSFTVTEAGYHVGPDGSLDAGGLELGDDIARCTGVTIYGTVARMLQTRMTRGVPGVTLLCCDNIRENGRKFQARLFDFLERRGDHALRSWVEAYCTFPDGMVDRITPRATDELRARVVETVGVDDPAAIMAEDYVQWVVEDDFAQGRPRLELAGVEFVNSVRPYEEAKIRVLNASHALLAWRGAALGLRYIHECVSVPELREAIIRYVTDDVMACLPGSPVDLAAYRDRVISRFGNPYIKDTVARVAADGYAKMAGWIAPTLQECLDAGDRPVATAAVAAAFLDFLELWRAGRLNFTYTDQGMDEHAVRAMLASPDPVALFARDAVLWGVMAGRPDLLRLFRETFTQPS